MTSNLTHAIALIGPAARERANTRLVMLIGTLEYVTNHCTDTNLAGRLICFRLVLRICRLWSVNALKLSLQRWIAGAFVGW